MKFRDSIKVGLGLAATAVAMSLSTPTFAMDADAAQALAKASGCLKCHSVDKKKDGPPYKDVAAKYKGKADAEQKLHVHLTSNPKIKIDGIEEEHVGLKTKNDAEIRNVIQWILSR